MNAITAPNFFPKGSAVLVKCARGDLRENVVWDDLGDVVLVCARDQFDQMQKGYAAPMPIGFHRSDVKSLGRE